MLKDIYKNNYRLYYRKDVEGFGLPMFDFGQSPKEDYWSKTMLKKEYGITLTEEQLNNPHGFARGQNGYYPVWNLDKLQGFKIPGDLIEFDDISEFPKSYKLSYDKKYEVQGTYNDGSFEIIDDEGKKCWIDVTLHEFLVKGE